MLSWSDDRHNRGAVTAAAEPLSDSPTTVAPSATTVGSPRLRCAVACTLTRSHLRRATPHPSHAWACGVELICIPNYNQVAGTVLGPRELRVGTGATLSDLLVDGQHAMNERGKRGGRGAWRRRNGAITPARSCVHDVLSTFVSMPYSISTATHDQPRATAVAAGAL